MNEAVDVISFLTKYGVCKDMQKEIMSYYQLPKQKYWLLYIDTDEDTNKFEYHETFRYCDIDNICLINLYKKLYELNSQVENPDRKMIHYDEEGYTYIENAEVFKKITSKDLKIELKKTSILDRRGIEIPIVARPRTYSWRILLRKVKI